jgi:colanic acid/amylovoran biosynthesis glycosyltransferase
MELSENTKIPWSSTVHSGDFIEAASIARKFNSAKGVRFISNYLINKAKMQYELPTNTPVIHLGVTTKDLSPNSHNLKSKQYIVCVANLIPIKNHRLIIKVAEELKKMGFDFQIDLIGDGPERLSLQELVVELGLQNYINFVGYLPHDELIDLLKSGKYVLSILSSTITSNLQQEGIPVAILESLACGIPVLASNTGGIPEIFGYSEHFLFEDNSEKALEEKIVNILTLSNEDYEELRVRSKAIVDSKFNSEINGNIYAAWLKSLRDTN